MNKTELLNKASRTINKVGFNIKKHSPTILVTAGVVGTVASGVLACKATLKAHEVVEEHNSKMDDIREAIALETDEYTVEDSKRDTVITYTQTAVGFVKLYAPAVVLGALSVTAIVCSHKILTKRNAALAAAYTAVDKGFKEYRERVIERFGKDVDHELRYNIKAKEFTKTIVKEDGTEEIVTEVVEIADPNNYSEYAKFFDDGCEGWTKDPEHNLYFLKCQQNYANDMLKSRGHLFLNEVYDLIGIPRTKAGNIVGWIYDEKNPIGDNFVDFGLFDSNREKVRDFVNGYERTILLDFNVDGPILNNL